MPTLTSLLKGKRSSQIRTGTVTAGEAAGQYRVTVGGRDLLVRSAISGTIGTGTRVIMNTTSDGTYIIGSERARPRLRREVWIRG